jgi:hypothetical protein
MIPKSSSSPTRFAGHGQPGQPDPGAGEIGFQKRNQNSLPEIDIQGAILDLGKYHQNAAQRTAAGPL